MTMNPDATAEEASRAVNVAVMAYLTSEAVQGELPERARVLARCFPEGIRPASVDFSRPGTNYGLVFSGTVAEYIRQTVEDLPENPTTHQMEAHARGLQKVDAMLDNLRSLIPS